MQWKPKRVPVSRMEDDHDMQGAAGVGWLLVHGESVYIVDKKAIIMVQYTVSRLYNWKTN